MPKPKAGDVVEIDLGDGTKAVARVLDPPLIEFFDLRPNVRAPVDASGVEGPGVLLRVDVMDGAIRSRRWPIIGRHAVSAAPWTGPERFFKEGPHQRRAVHLLGGSGLR